MLKSLREIGFEHYYQAEQTGWVLYLEGSTDLAILQAFAHRLGHEGAIEALERPFVHYVGNDERAMRRHYYGLREALPDLRFAALFDRFESAAAEAGQPGRLVWKRREIENYLCTQATLEAYAKASAQDVEPGPLLALAEANRRIGAMREAIREVGDAMETLGRGSPWSPDAKVSDDFLTPLFRAYFEKLDLPNLMSKKSFYELARHVPDHEIDPEIGEKLDAIASAAKSATPRGSDY